MNSTARKFETASDCISHAAAVRNRLMNPAKAVRPAKPAMVLTIVRAPEVINYPPPTRGMITNEPKAHMSAWIDHRVEQSRGVHPKEYVRFRSRQLGVKASDVRGPSRRYKIARVRHLIMYEVKTHFPDMSLSAIGHIFGGRDHATVRHAVHKIRQERGEPIEIEPRVYYRDDDALVALIKAKYLKGVGPRAIAAAHGMSASSIHRLAKASGWREERMADLRQSS